MRLVKIPSGDGTKTKGVNPDHVVSVEIESYPADETPRHFVTLNLSSGNPVLFVIDEVPLAEMAWDIVEHLLVD